MARKQETFTLDGDEYSCVQLPARQGFTLYNRLVKALMPALRTLTGDKAGDSAAMDLIASAIEGMPQELTDELVRVFGESCQVKHGDVFMKLTPDFTDQHFAGRYPHMLRWIFACLRVNYADFLAGIVGSKNAG